MEGSKKLRLQALPPTFSNICKLSDKHADNRQRGKPTNQIMSTMDLLKWAYSICEESSMLEKPSLQLSLEGLWPIVWRRVADLSPIPQGGVNQGKASFLNFCKRVDNQFFPCALMFEIIFINFPMVKNDYKYEIIVYSRMKMIHAHWIFTVKHPQY